MLTSSNGLVTFPVYDSHNRHINPVGFKLKNNLVEQFDDFDKNFIEFHLAGYSDSKISHTNVSLATF